MRRAIRNRIPTKVSSNHLLINSSSTLEEIKFNCSLFFFFGESALGLFLLFMKSVFLFGQQPCNSPTMVWHLGACIAEALCHSRTVNKAFDQ
jgi:hypothetical protein